MELAHIHQILDIGITDRVETEIVDGLGVNIPEFIIAIKQLWYLSTICMSTCNTQIQVQTYSRILTPRMQHVYT